MQTKAITLGGFPYMVKIILVARAIEIWEQRTGCDFMKEFLPFELFSWPLAEEIGLPFDDLFQEWSLRQIVLPDTCR